MVNLTFQKIEDHWECEFVAQADFNLHIEKESNGYLYLQQKYALEDKYASVRGADFAPCDKVIDNDFIGTIYPKLMKVISEVAPTKATVRYNENILLDSPPYRALYEAAGAHWNAETGYYELNGLTDITEEEMGQIYAGSSMVTAYTASCIDRNIKTNIVKNEFNNLAITQFRGTFSYNKAKYIKVSKDISVTINPLSIDYMFYYCTKLETIYNIFNLIYLSNRPSDPFMFCHNLKTLRLRNLKHNISIESSPLLSLESVKYMVDNAANTNAITITVHQDVYNKLVDETNTEWHEVFTTAQGKQISFAVPTA